MLGPCDIRLLLFQGLMMMSLGFLNYFFNNDGKEVKTGPIRTLLIGLGGGMFSLFLVNVIPNVSTYIAI